MTAPPPLFREGHTVLIAEVGSNHGGDVGLAREAIAAAKEAGADVVKFQMYDAERLVDDKMPVLKYIEQSHATQRERFKSLQLSAEVFEDLSDRSAKAGLHFMCTPFYEDAVSVLDPLVPAFKIASGDLTNLSLIKTVMGTGKPIVLSTGLSRLDEIDWAVGVIPSDRLRLLHCVGAYPTSDEQVNLNTIPFLAERFGLPVGFSDHSVGATACIAAVALGATIIEKHFLPDDERKVADKALSIGVEGFRDMTREIRRIEMMRGEKSKILQPDEEYFCRTLRRSLYATVDIAAGQPIKDGWLVPLRPWSPDAVSPTEIEAVNGRTLRRDLEAGAPVMQADLN